MTTKDTTYCKTETKTNWRINGEAVTLFIPSDQPSRYFVFGNAWVYAPGGSPKINKDFIYTTMGGSTPISNMVYIRFGSSPKLNHKIRW